jgi:hypothetical protein
MRPIQLIVPIASFAIALGSFSAEAQDRGGRQGRAGQSHQGQGRSQSGASARQGGYRGQSGQSSSNRGGQGTYSAQGSGGRASQGGPSAGGAVERSPGYAQGSQRGSSRDTQSYGRGGGAAPRGDYNSGRSNDHYQSYGGGHGNNYGYRGGSGYGYGSYGRGSYGYGAYGYSSHGYRSYGYRGVYGYANGYAYSPYYYAPRPLAYGYAPRHYYGSGGHLSIYFGFGSGYLYGAPYSGRIYGYRAPAASYGGEGQYYGDIRLQVNPPNAEVYVDGYYAGIVDDFDGQYQRLALEAGPHKIEIGVQGVQPQVFDVYVDASRTVDLRADLLR